MEKVKSFFWWVGAFIQLILYPILAGRWCSHCQKIGAREDMLKFFNYCACGLIGLIASGFSYFASVPWNGVSWAVASLFYLFGAYFLFKLINKRIAAGIVQ